MAELMKGQKWRDRKHKMEYPAWAEVKADEIRCHVIVCPQTKHVSYLSFAGKPLANLERYAPGWAALATETGVWEFDTGFEANGNFNDSYRWVRSTKGLPPELTDARGVFFLFDLPTMLGVPFAQRVTWRHNTVVLAMGLGLDYVLLPHGQWAHNADDVDAIFLRYRAEGHEGVMLKSMQHEYVRGKRSDGWLKVKPEDDADGTITALHEAISEAGVPLGRVGSVTIAVEDGSEATPHGIGHDLGEDMFRNPAKYIGQWAEFKFMERDRQGGYRHPTFNRIREEK